MNCSKKNLITPADNICSITKDKDMEQSSQPTTTTEGGSKKKNLMNLDSTYCSTQKDKGMSHSPQNQNIGGEELATHLLETLGRLGMLGCPTDQPENAPKKNLITADESIGRQLKDKDMEHSEQPRILNHAILNRRPGESDESFRQRGREMILAMDKGEAVEFPETEMCQVMDPAGIRDAVIKIKCVQHNTDSITFHGIERELIEFYKDLEHEVGQCVSDATFSEIILATKVLKKDEKWDFVGHHSTDKASRNYHLTVEPLSQSTIDPWVLVRLKQKSIASDKKQLAEARRQRHKIAVHQAQVQKKLRKIEKKLKDNQRRIQENERRIQEFIEDPMKVINPIFESVEADHEPNIRLVITEYEPKPTAAELYEQEVRAHMEKVQKQRIKRSGRKH